MKKYFIINSQIVKTAYKEYEEELEKQRRLYREFCKLYGIEAKEFYVDRRQFAIIASKNDYEKFKDQMTKGGQKFGLSKFKETSVIGKEWKKIANKEDVKVCSTPILMWLFKGNRLTGKSRQNIFEIEGILYGSLEIEDDFELEPDQITEMKASEFHKIIEDYNASLKTEA